MAEFEKTEGKRKNVPRRHFLVIGAAMTVGVLAPQKTRIVNP
jgi:hypothetical protein